jgi:hypothetical protein
MGVLETLSNSTKVSSAIRSPAGSAPDRINSRNFNCALTVWEPLSSNSIMGSIVYSSAPKSLKIHMGGRMTIDEKR